MADSPPLAPSGASLDSRIGSPLCMFARTTRSATLAGSLTAPAGTLVTGHGATRTMGGVSLLPMTMSTLATTTWLVRIADSCDIQRAAIHTAANAATIETP